MSNVFAPAFAAAKRRGQRLGAPMKWRSDIAKQARKLLDNGDLNAQEVANVLKVSRRTLFRGLRDAREHDEFTLLLVLLMPRPHLPPNVPWP